VIHLAPQERAELVLTGLPGRLQAGQELTASVQWECEHGRRHLILWRHTLTAEEARRGRVDDAAAIRVGLCDCEADG